jgi:membrane protease YdiL (CAAX protease family)
MAAPPIAGDRIRSAALRHPIATFLVLAYVLTIAVVLLPVPEGVGGPLENIVGVAVPAFVVTAAVGGSEGVRDLLRRCLHWRIPIHWYAVALMPAVSLLVLAPLLYGQDALAALGDNWPRLLTSFLPTFAVMLLLDTLPEESGATGFLFARLQDRHGPLRAALLTALFFWLWHVPGLVRDSRTLAELGALLTLYLVGHLASRLIVGWLYNATGSSVLIGAIFHATFNSTVNKPGLGVAVLDLPQDDVLGIVTGLVLLAAVAIAVVTRGRLGKNPQRVRDRGGLNGRKAVEGRSG